MELSLERITQLLLRTPQGQALREQQEAEDERQALFTKRATLQHQQATDLPPLAKDVERAARDLEAAHTVMEQKRDAYYTAASAHELRKAALESQLMKTENKIRASASPLLDEFIAQCWRRQEHVRNKGFQSYTTQGEYSFEAGKYLMITTTNADTVSACLVALKQAIRSAEASKLENLTDDEVSARVAALEDTIPSVAGVALPPTQPLSLSAEAYAIQDRTDIARATARAIDRQKQRAQALRG